MVVNVVTLPISLIGTSFVPHIVLYFVHALSQYSYHTEADINPTSQTKRVSDSLVTKLVAKAKF